MTDDLRCAPWTLAEGVDPAGSAVRLDRLVLVEIPLPWPADIADTSWLTGHDVAPLTRLQAIVPETPRLDGGVLVTCWDRAGARYEGVDLVVDAADVRDAVGALAAGDPPPAHATAAPAEVLVCGHGTRDACCGGSGTRLAVEARAALGDIRVRRTSHLGGHRFAPTALHLPDGRAWAYLDADALAGIVSRTLDPTEARARYRGHVGLESLAQVVEADRLLSAGWGFADVDELAADVAPADDGGATVTLTWADDAGGGRQRELVRVRRHYPVLQCGLPPEQARKTAAEYEIA